MSANNDTFNEAISLHQSKKFDEALNVYLKLLDEGQTQSLTQEQASAVSHNIAVLYMQQGEANLAYIYNKKALTLSPGNSAAQQFFKSHFTHFKVSEVPREISSLEQLNNLGLKYVPFELLAALAIIFVALTAKSVFHFLLERKKSLINNTAPSAISLKFYVFAALLITCGSLLFAKYFYLTQPTGIIKSPMASVQTSAGANQAVITEVPQGNVVQILQTKDVDGIIYAQIKIPGAFSGWIKKSDLEPLSSTN